MKKAIQQKLPIFTFVLGLSLAINVFAFAGKLSPMKSQAAVNDNISSQGSSGRHLKTKRVSSRTERIPRGVAFTDLKLIWEAPEIDGYEFVYFIKYQDIDVISCKDLHFDLENKKAYSSTFQGGTTAYDDLKNLVLYAVYQKVE